jgi:uncharacterized protein (TIGR00725 family)
MRIMIDTSTQWVAVLGGAHHYDRAQLHAAYRCGAELARRGRNVLTGATTGIPYAAALGAKDGGAMVVGISPAVHAADHVERFAKPVSAADLVIYSGLAVEGRGPLILRSAGAAVFIGGEMGTLAEFAAGWLCGCPTLGVLESSGGITKQLAAIAASMQTRWGSTVVCASDPVALAGEICDRLDAAERPQWLERDRAAVADVLETLAEVRRC